MNHEAVPSRWSLRAILWLVEGSGGESQLQISFRSMFSVKYVQRRESPKILGLTLDLVNSICSLLYLD